jgi:DNA-binding HxlR family transcriptional regulator
MDSDRIYRHFCMMGRALEVVGERWTLPVVRDLLLGPRRFTDLVRSLAEITPTRLTERLRSLEAAGLVVRESAGREVWYRLTDAGRDLEPVVDALTAWGIEHARERPRPGLLVHPDALMNGTKVWLNRYGAPPPGPLEWVWRFPDDRLTLRFTGAAWELARGAAEQPAVTVDSTPEAWARFLTSPRAGRVLPADGIRREGSRRETRRFARTFGA